MVITAILEDFVPVIKALNAPSMADMGPCIESDSEQLIRLNPAANDQQTSLTLALNSQENR